MPTFITVVLDIIQQLTVISQLVNIVLEILRAFGIIA